MGNNTFSTISNTLDSSTIVNGQGPDLVEPGLTLHDPNASLRLLWQGNGYFHLPTRTLGTDGIEIDIVFNSFVSAAGLDLFAYGGFPNVTSVTVIGTDHVTVLGVIGPLPGSGHVPLVPEFAGWYDAAGIGELRVHNDQGFGPVIDNLEFGNVPEPASLGLLGLGLLALGVAHRRNKG